MADELTQTEQRVLALLRALSDFGELRVVKQNGKIVAAEITDKVRFIDEGTGDSLRQRVVRP